MVGERRASGGGQEARGVMRRCCERIQHVMAVLCNSLPDSVSPIFPRPKLTYLYSIHHINVKVDRYLNFFIPFAANL